MTLFVATFAQGRHTVPSVFDYRVLALLPNEKALVVRQGLFEIRTWQCPTLTWGNPTLPSALIRFTSEFGMESGGTVSLWLPGKTDNNLGKIILIQSVSNYFLLYLSCKIMIAFYHDFCARRTNSTYCCLSHPIDLLIICLQRQLLFEAF